MTGPGVLLWGAALLLTAGCGDGGDGSQGVEGQPDAMVSQADAAGATDAGGRLDAAAEPADGEADTDAGPPDGGGGARQDASADGGADAGPDEGTRDLCGCIEDADCASGVCHDCTCLQPTCTDGRHNGTETGLDCGGGCASCADGQPCATAEDCASGVCAEERCEAPTCGDRALNGDESDTDCGGSCPPCALQAPCRSGADCASRSCADERCAAATCADGVPNGDESDTDCGPGCDACPAGARCEDDADCAEELTCRAGFCRPPTCGDGARNGGEAGTDCGGPCLPCVAGGACAEDDDCASGVCADAFCRRPACGDGQRNGGEPDIDCGGPCAPCAPAAACRFAADCVSGRCVDGRCAEPTCGDGVRNLDESDVDCGGSCPRCGPAGRCGDETDCDSGVCVADLCQLPRCGDGVRNGDETDHDCGGSCAPCAAGLACGDPTHCSSGVCQEHACRPPACGDGVRNGDERGADCGGGCGPCPDGAGCAAPADCLSRVCRAGACQPASCGDATTNGDETDMDCGGGCPPCGAALACLVPDDCASSVCVERRCAAPNCTDEVHNGDERDVDCGGGCGACPDGLRCSADAGCASNLCDPFEGRCVPARDCSDLLGAGFVASGRYTIDPDGLAGPEPPFETYCDMDTDGGGWTLVLKADGHSDTFRYDAPHWSSEQAVAPWETGLDGREAKLASYWSVPFNELRVDLMAAEDQGSFALFHAAPSLHAVIATGEAVPTQQGWRAWRALLPSASLQVGCGMEGFNVGGDRSRVRIGVVTDNDGLCRDPDSRLGVGAAGTSCGQDGANSVGGEGRCGGDLGDLSVRALAWVFVRRRPRAPAACSAVLGSAADQGSGVYVLQPPEDGALPYRTWCDMEAEGGGWTTLLQLDGAAQTFSYDAELWTNRVAHNASLVAPDDGHQAKLASFWALPFDELRLGMKVGDEPVRWATLPYSAPSLLDLLADGEHRATEQGAAFWLSLLPDPSLHAACVREGFNVAWELSTRARIGVVTSRNEDCVEPTARIAFGGDGRACHQDQRNACGNEARCWPAQGDRTVRALGFVMAR